jgi:flagellar hook-associated protein 3 FlgL
MSTTFTRLGSANTYDSAIRNISARQSALSNLQENLTSGKKVVRASDDPTSAANAERALTRISRIATDQRALDSQSNAIISAESALGDVTDALQRFRELVVSAGNGSHTNAERRTIAIELQGLRDQVFSVANQKDTNGQPLFSALGSALTPFVGPQATAPDYTFQGLPGQTGSSDVTIPFALDGDGAFMLQPGRDGIYNVTLGSVPNGQTLSTSAVTVTNSALVTGASYTVAITAVDSTTTPGTTVVSYQLTSNPPDAGSPLPIQTAPGYPSNQAANISVVGMPGLAFSISGAPVVGETITANPSPSIFSVLDNAIKDIGGATSANNASQAVSQALNNIDIGMGRISAVRGQAGDLLNRADRITTNQEKRSIQLEADRSRAEDLDMMQGISDFNNKQTGYQAALQTYASVQKLSLFNYVG